MYVIVRSDLTFLGRFTEDGIMVIDDHQSDVVVVDDVLRVFEAVVSAYEAITELRRTGAPEERRGLVLIAHSCAAGELHVLSEQCR